MDQRSRIPLYRWLNEKGYFHCQHPDQDLNTVSHLLMDGYRGGKICLPQASHGDFLQRYVESINQGFVVYISECRTPVFRFMADLDVVREQELEDEILLQYARDFQSIVQKFYPVGVSADLFLMLLFRTEPKVKSTEPPLVKTGVHIVFPNLYVTASMALHMREAIIGKFYCLYGSMVQQQNSWEDVVDQAVYVSNGLRMVGSHKTDKCLECRDKEPEKKYCGECGSWGKRDAGRVYSIWRVLDATGTEEPTFLTYLLQSRQQTIHLSSIRYFGNPTAGWSRYEGAPVAPIGINSSDAVEVNGRTTLMLKEDAEALHQMKNKVFLPKDTDKYLLIQKYLRMHINPKRYGQILVDNIVTNPKASYYIINVRGDGSSYCMNYRRDHNSNHIYFYMTSEGMYQKCNCTCNTTVNRSSGMCKNYRSKQFPLTDRIKAHFFGGSASKIGLVDTLKNDTVKRNPGGHSQSVGDITSRLQVILRDKWNQRHSEEKQTERGRRDKGTSLVTMNEQGQLVGRKRKAKKSPLKKVRKKAALEEENKES